MSSFLVTGAEGQLGRCFHAIAQEFPEHQLIFAKKTRVDLTLPITFEKAYQLKPFDGIINCAAYTHVDKAEEESALAHLINVEGIKNIDTTDIDNANRLGYKIKLLAVSEIINKRVYQRVHPTFIKKSFS